MSDVKHRIGLGTTGDLGGTGGGTGKNDITGKTYVEQPPLFTFDSTIVTFDSTVKTFDYEK